VTELIEFHPFGPVLLAILLGAVLGLDRELAAKPAGLRTHMLVAGAAAMLVTLGDAVATHMADSVARDMLRADPMRLVGAVVTGVSFLGAGTIIRQHSDHVEGLTTAASLLFVAALGIACAVGEYTLAASGTATALIILRLPVPGVRGRGERTTRPDERSAPEGPRDR
jgi:putative Mg2+ transporter-C (MgtC) family protein